MSSHVRDEVIVVVLIFLVFGLLGPRYSAAAAPVAA
jgi:hypothetical protein